MVPFFVEYTCWGVRPGPRVPNDFLKELSLILLVQLRNEFICNVKWWHIGPLGKKYICLPDRNARKSLPENVARMNR